MRRLFVGGHWHGRVVDVPEDREVWHVPVPSRIVWSPDLTAFDDDLKVDHYVLRGVQFDTVVMRVFVCGSSIAHPVDALIVAAGLSGTGGQ